MFAYRKKGRNGKLGRNYVVQWRNHLTGKRAEWTGYPDLDSTLRMGRYLEALSASRAYDTPIDGKLQRWIAGLDKRRFKNLVKLRLVDSPEERELGCEYWIEQFEAFLRREGRDERYIRSVGSSCREIATGTKSPKLSDINANKVEDFLAQLRHEGLAISSSNKKLYRLKTFFNWLVRRGVVDVSPVLRLSELNSQVDTRREYVPLTSEEECKLLNSVKTNPDRYWCYRLALDAGLRANEIRTLTRSSFTFGPRPSVTIEAANNKCRRPDVIFLSTQMARGLKKYLAKKHPSTLAFNLPRDAAAAFRKDVVAAGIPDAGNGYFHSLRETFCTRAGSRPEMDAVSLMKLTRHTSLAMVQRYLHSSEDRIRRLINDAGNDR